MLWRALASLGLLISVAGGCVTHSTGDPGAYEVVGLVAD